MWGCARIAQWFSARIPPPNALEKAGSLRFCSATASVQQRAALLRKGGGFLDGFFDRFPSLSSALLNATDQFILHTLFIGKVIIGQLCPSLFQFALGNIPITFYLQLIHK